MVAIDPSQWDRERKAAKLSRDGLSLLDRELIGKAVRIEVPMQDQRTLLLSADLLRGLANSIEFTLQRDDIPLRMRLQMVKNETMMINRRIREMYDQARMD